MTYRLNQAEAISPKGRLSGLLYITQVDGKEDENYL